MLISISFQISSFILICGIGGAKVCFLVLPISRSIMQPQEAWSGEENTSHKQFSNSLFHCYVNIAIQGSVSNSWIFLPPSDFSSVRDICHCHNWTGGATGMLDALPEIQWVEARDVAEHFIMYRTVLTERNYPAQNVKGEKP